jgi:hypothetical protein
MNLEVLAWAPRRREYIEAVTTTMVPRTGLPLATYAKDMQTGQTLVPFVMAPHVGLNLDEIGDLVAVPAVSNPDDPMGPPLTPAVMVGGYHVNFRFHYPLADMLILDLPQTDAEGNPLPLWERTHLLEMFPDATYQPPSGRVPEGYVGIKQLRLFDPMIIKSRSRIWA